MGPKTGRPDPLRTLGVRMDGRPIFPIAGGAPDGDDPGDPGDGDQGGDSGRTFTQAELDRYITREKRQEREATHRRLVEELGCTPAEAKQRIEAAQQAERDKMSEADRRIADAEARERKLAERETATAEANLDARIVRALGPGVAEESVEDAVALIRRRGASTDTDAGGLAELVGKLRESMPGLFGVSTGGQPPKLPSNDGRPPHRPSVPKGRAGERGLAEAERRGNPQPAGWGR